MASHRAGIKLVSASEGQALNSTYSVILNLVQKKFKCNPTVETDAEPLPLGIC